MELIVFDLDGTLLVQESAISDYTSETLKLLAEQEITYSGAARLERKMPGMFNHFSSQIHVDIRPVEMPG